ncbi:hypothetical protein KIL84_017399 [Mauremys mutica]|uniref:Uncharacterized protein n=1 Tax=Mauremys mutica TaxID=74926 RepID=A0A9D3X6E4_9SAUR|nr:hypothetical protein KIL84_017399 [Mauremys mutica]
MKGTMPDPQILCHCLSLFKGVTIMMIYIVVEISFTHKIETDWYRGPECKLPRSAELAIFKEMRNSSFRTSRFLLAEMSFVKRFCIVVGMEFSYKLQSTSGHAQQQLQDSSGKHRFCFDPPWHERCLTSRFSE